MAQYNRLHVTLLPHRYGFLLIGLYIISFLTVLYVDYNLPEPVLIKDESQHPDAFIAERAQNFLRKLTDLGPRVVGSKENEIDAVELLQREIADILSTANKNQYDISTEVWEVSGSYYLDFKPHGAINAYGNVQNVVVLLKSKSSRRSGRAILVNAHFDSVPTSPGASDDGIMCAVMLESLRKLTHPSSSTPPPLHDIILLWNGAEETPLHAAHGFVTRALNTSASLHTVPRIIVNLESGGGGPGREILFQAGPGAPWLVRLYGAAVPHPHATAAAQELFQANVVPSDTDFRIFRDYGGMQGYDMAFARNGYRYHTKYDSFESIPLGSYQHAGDNVLALLRALRNSPEVFRNVTTETEETNEPAVVYFDVLYFVLVLYSAEWAAIINVLISLLSFYKAVEFFMGQPRAQRFRSVLRFGLAVFAAWAAAVLFVGATAFILDSVGLSMRWYRMPISVATLYLLPAAAAAASGFLLVDICFAQTETMPARKADAAIHLTRTLLTIILLIGTTYGIRSCYAICIPIAFNVFGYAVESYYKKLALPIGVIIEFLVSTFIFYQCMLIFTLFIPITGRFGSDRNPEFIIGAISLLQLFLLTSFQIPRIYMLNKPFIFIAKILGASIVISAILLAAFDRYSGDKLAPAPQRFLIFHTTRTIRDRSTNVTLSDNGYFLLNLDRNSPQSVLPYVEELRSKGRPVGGDCDKALLCGLPLISPRMLAIARESTWVPSTTPPTIAPAQYARLHLIRRESLPDGVRMHFTASGPDRINVYISPKDGVEVRNISLAIVTTPAKSLDSGRPIYFINYVWGRKPAPLHFAIDLKVESPEINVDLLDIAVSGKHVHMKRDGIAPEFQQFLDQFPDWADVTSAQATFESFVY